MSLPASQWVAKWISFSQHPDGDRGVFAFRKKFHLTSVAYSFEIKISADQRYKLYVNGRFVDFGPQRGDLHHWFYETLDIAPFLKSGENWIVVQVSFFGRYAPMAQHTARQGLVVEGEGVSTPGDWQVAKIEGWSFEMLHSLVGPFYIDVGPGEIIDAIGIGNFRSENGGDLEWREPNVISDATERGTSGGGTPWMLVPRSLPPMLYARRDKDPVDRDANTAFSIKQVKKGERLLLDYQELLTAFPKFTLFGKEGTRIELTYAESFFIPDVGKGNRDEIDGKEMWGYQDVIVLDGSERTFEPCWWRTYRYLRIEADDDIEVKAVEAFETGYPIQEDAKFVAEGTKEIWDVSVRTVKRCAGETYFDCPYYEQLQYAGDTRIQALIGYYLSTDRRLQRNAVEQFSWSVMPDGLTQSRYPSRQTQVIPPFSLWWITMLYDQWLYDRVPVNRVHIDQAHRVLDAWDRLIEGDQDETFWTFGDWVPGWKMGEPPGKARSSVHLFTKWLAELALARMEGAEAKVQAIKVLLEKTERSASGLAFHPADTHREPSEHAAALFRICQQMAGLRPDPWPDSALKSAAKCTYYFSYYKHLAKNPADYLAELDPWREMVANGLTTFAENPEPVRSDCHAWSAHPILGFLQIVAGVTSTEEGWRKARIAPRPGRLKSFTAEIPHFDGTIKVELSDRKMSVTCPVPFELVWGDASRELEPGSYSF